MTNTSSWPAAVSANNAIKMSLTENQMSAKKSNSQEKERFSSAGKTAKPRRYSFDDNGSGYRGL